MPTDWGDLLAWKPESPGVFASGIVSLGGAVAIGVLLWFFLVPSDRVPPQVQIIVLLIGAAMLFGGAALVAIGIAGRRGKAPSPSS